MNVHSGSYAGEGLTITNQRSGVFRETHHDAKSGENLVIVPVKILKMGRALGIK